MWPSCLLCIRYLDVFGFNETKDDDFQESDIRNERRALSEFDRQLNLEATDDSPQVPTVTDDAFSRIEYMLMVNEYEQQLMGIVLLFMGINVGLLCSTNTCQKFARFFTFCLQLCAR